MSTNVGTIQYLVEIDTSTLKGQLKSVDQAVENTAKGSEEAGGRGERGFIKMGAALGAVAGIAQAVTTKAISVLSNSIGDAVRRVDTLNNAGRAFQNMGFAAAETTQTMDALKASILGLPTSLDAAVRNVQLLAASTGDIKKSQKIFQALNDGILGFGGSAEQVDTAVIQLSQAFAGGRVMAQDWNSMLNAGLGPSLNAIAKTMGKTTTQLKEGLSDGSISVKKFQDALITLDEKGGGGMASLQKIVKDASSGIGTGMANAKTAVTRGLAAIIEAIGSANISSLISKIGEVSEKALKVVGGLVKLLFSGDYDGKLFGGVFSEDSKVVDVVLKMRAALIDLKDAATLLITGDFQKKMFGGAFSEDSLLVNGILTVREAIESLIDFVSNNMWVLNALVIAISPLAGIALLIAQNWQNIKPILDNVVGAFLLFWEMIKPFRDFVADQFSQAWKDLSAAFADLWEQLKPFLPWLELAGKAVLLVSVIMSGLFIAALILVTGAVAALVAVLARLIGIGAQVVSFFSGLPGTIVSALGNMSSVLYNAGRDLIKGLLNGAGSLLPNIGKFFLDSLPGFIREPFKKALGIRSPSKVFAGFGKNITQGLINGVESGMGQVNATIAQLGNTTISPMIAPSPASSFSDVGEIVGSSSASTTIIHKVDGLVVARSNSDMRDLFSKGIELVNQQRRAAGQPQIGGA